MKVYNYDPDTKHYLGTSEARLDPMATQRLGENVYALPAHATFTEPPFVKEGKIPVFINDEWLIVEDLRGTIVYKKDTPTVSVVLNVVGSIPEEWTDQVPTEFPIWDKDKWIVDKTAQSLYDLAQVAEEKKVQDVITAKEKISTLESDISKAKDITEMKTLMVDLVKQIKIITD
jgi:hypothetical protein